MKPAGGLILGMMGLIAVLLPSQQPASAQADLEAILRLHYQAVNRGDAAAAIAFFTDDAVLIRGQCSQFVPCVGKTEIQRQVQGEITNKVSFGVLRSATSGNTVTAHLGWWNVAVPGAGIQRVLYNSAITFSGEKISRMVDEIDLSDAQSTVFANFRRVTAPFNAIITSTQRGDVDGAMAWFAEDAIFQGFGLCASTPCLGKDAIRPEMEREAADRTTFIAFGAQPRVIGDVLTTQRHLGSDSVRAAGVDRILVSMVSETRGNLVVSLRLEPVATDAQTAAFLQAQGSRAPTPSQMPGAGGEAQGSLTAIAALGAGLLSLGARLRLCAARWEKQRAAESAAD